MAISKITDIANPSYLRFVVQETNLEIIQIGTLFIPTYKGGSLGKEGNHDVILPDIKVSQYHLKFQYDEKSSMYKCIDLGSRNGTILNGKRMSSSSRIRACCTTRINKAAFSHS
uniref:FHA domain-containing protein n=1 Tax=Megaselia scalaris TaxID=36166 RepID=T1G9Y4_MEGSC